MGNQLNLCNGNNGDKGSEQMIVHERDAMVDPRRWPDRRSFFDTERSPQFEQDSEGMEVLQEDNPGDSFPSHFQKTEGFTNSPDTRKEDFRETKVLGENINYSNVYSSNIMSSEEKKEGINAPKLSLIIISKGPLKGSSLEITPNGLKGTKRSNKDGYTYFGSKIGTSTGKENFSLKDTMNDFIIPGKEKEIGKTNAKHFYIRYDYDELEYKIKDLGIGSGVFMKVDYPLPLKDNHLLNIGESFIIVNLIPFNTKINTLESESDSDEYKVDHAEEIPKIRLKIFGGPNAGKVFYSNGMDTDEIKIGRSPHCSIKIDDEVLSKYQCRVYYDFNVKTWVLEDGNSKKPSLNGTWLYLNEEYPIYNGMVFKAHQTLFRASYTK